MASPAGYGQISHDDLVQQVVRLGDEVQQLKLDNATLKAQMQDVKNSGGSKGGHKSELRNLKGLYPSKFDPAKDVFQTWAEDFVRWVRLESDGLATALERAPLR